MKQRRGTAAAWVASANAELAEGEIGLETDTGRIKIGHTNTRTWSTLPYVAPRITVGTQAPSGGLDGDIYLQYQP